MKKTLSLALILCLSYVFLACGYSFAKRSSKEGAVVIKVLGKVQIKEKKARKWKDAEERMFLGSGDTIKTEKDSWVEIGFGEEADNIIKVKENTEVELSDFGPITLGLLRGEIRSLVEKLESDSTFQIRTPIAVCGARGTGWDTNLNGKIVTVDAYENDVFFQTINKRGKVLEESTINAGKRAVLKDISSPISILNVPPEKLNNWKKWKELLPDKLKDIKLFLRVANVPLFKKARADYAKALFYIERGDKMFRKGFGAAKKAYEKASNYLLETTTAYKEIERVYGIDLSKEIYSCDTLYRNVHVKISQVQRKLMKRQ